MLENFRCMSENIVHVGKLCMLEKLKIAKREKSILSFSNMTFFQHDFFQHDLKISKNNVFRLRKNFSRPNLMKIIMSTRHIWKKC